GAVGVGVHRGRAADDRRARPAGDLRACRAPAVRPGSAATAGPSATGAGRGLAGGGTLSRGDGVWITGVGAATPLGHSYAEVADALLAGRSGIAVVSDFHVADHPSQIAGRVDRVPRPSGWDEAAFGALPRIEQLAVWCVEQALRDAGWWDRRTSA